MATLCNNCKFSVIQEHGFNSCVLCCTNCKPFEYDYVFGKHQYQTCKKIRGENAYCRNFKRMNILQRFLRKLLLFIS